MTDLGGWPKVNKEVYDPGGVWDSLFTGEAEGGGERPMSRSRPATGRRPACCSAGRRCRTWA